MSTPVAEQYTSTDWTLHDVIIKRDDLQRIKEMAKPDATPFRTFETGATRDLDDTKIDYEGFLSPLVLEAFGVYMHKNRHMRDGSLRDSDNWQKGIPQDQYMKSLFRHMMSLWKLHRGFKSHESIEDSCMGILFNVQGYMHELLKK